MGKKKRKSKTGRNVKAGSLKNWFPVVIITVIAVAGLAAGLALMLGGSHSDSTQGQGGDYKGIFPRYVTSSPTPNAVKGYTFAVDYTEQLDQIPCFCGCGKHAGHKSVRYCFIKQDNPQNEKIQFDQHGSDCKMCVDIVLDAVDGLQNGDSLKEVRARIEDRWKDDMDSMTPTPPVEA